MGMPEPYIHLGKANKVIENPEITGDDMKFQVMEHLKNALDALERYEGDNPSDKEITRLSTISLIGKYQRQAGISNL
jgi:hypothetical protein